MNKPIHMNKTRSIVKFLIKYKLGKFYSLFNFFYISKYPLSKSFGMDLGTALDRYYIEKFLDQESSSIKGSVMEIAESTYTEKFGKTDVTRSDILHVNEENENATIVGDLVSGIGIPKDQFDCMILTQTFHFIFDYASAIQNCHEALKKDGVLLSTFPGISQISRYDMNQWGEYWRFTTLSAKLIFEKIFGEGNVKITAYGNVKTACAHLQGIPLECMRGKDLNYFDRNFELIIGVKATKK